MVKRLFVLTMAISASVILASCGSTITQADLDAAYQQGYNAGREEVEDIGHPVQKTDDVSKEFTDNSKETDSEETNNIKQPSATDNNTSENATPSVNQPQPDDQITDQSGDIITPVPDIASVIAAMQASAPLIDTKDVILNEGTEYETYDLFMPGEHIGEYNGIQVDQMRIISGRAYQEKYYAVTDDLENVENTLRNAGGKNWFELGYTNCIPAILYDSRRNVYEENPYDMVHPGWEHSYAVLYACVWPDGTPGYGVYYIRVSNDTDHEVMAILCPITYVGDGLNIIY